MKKIILVFFLLLMGSVIADAAPVLNNSASKIVYSTLSTTDYNATNSTFQTGGIVYSIEIDRTLFGWDFTTYKFIDELQIPMKISSLRYYNGGTGCSQQVQFRNNYADLPEDGYGYTIYERVTPASFFVDGFYYGSGSFGFTSSPNPKYYIKINSYAADSVISNFTGVHNVSISYDHGVFNGVTWYDFYASGTGGNFDNCNLVDFSTDNTNFKPGMYGYINDSIINRYGYTQSDATDYIYINKFSKWSNYWEYWKNSSDSTQWINVFRNNSDTRVIFTRNNSVIYDQRNTTDISNYYFANTNLLTASFQNMGNSQWTNYTLEGASVPESISGSVDFSKEIYPSNEDINISYSLTTPDFNNKSYYMKFFNPSDQLLATFQITNSSGTWQPSFDKNVIGNYSVWLGYQNLGCMFFCADFFLDDDYANYGNQPTQISGNITTDKNTYNASETMAIFYNTTTAGQISILSQNGFVTSRTILIQVGNNKATSYTFQPDDPLGNYTLNLEYNAQGNWIILGSKSVSLVSQTGTIQFLLTSYYQTENAEFYFYPKETGNVTIYDSNGSVKYYRTVTAGDLDTRIDDNLYIKNTDPAGTWTAKLYNATDLVAQDTITVFLVPGGGITPTVTSTATPVPGTTVDYVGNRTARKNQENSFLNMFYGTFVGLFSMAVLATFVYLIKKMRF